MIIISAGLQKSGSGLYFNLTNDLLVAAGKQDIREIKRHYALEYLLKNYNCNIGNLGEDNLKPLLPIHEEGKSFVVKTHEGPTDYLLQLMQQGIVKATCIYRDPRDVLLSVIDRAEKKREKGKNDTFASCSTIANSIPKIQKWLDNSIMKWLQLEKIFKVRYEDLLERPIEILEQLSRFLAIQSHSIDLEKIYAAYDRENLDAFKKNYLHFNVGQTRRYKTLMLPEDIEICNQHFAPYLQQLGYSLE